jgi:hypothetical protein
MVPTLALGIPGSTTTAIILAGLLVQGVRPGPHLFTEQPTLLYAVFSSMLLANLLYLALGLGFAKIFARITLIPPQFLWPAVFVLSVIGAYAPNQAMAEVWVAIAFGFIGFFMRRFGFSPAPLVIGLVLGSCRETLKQSPIFDLRTASSAARSRWRSSPLPCCFFYCPTRRSGGRRMTFSISHVLHTTAVALASKSDIAPLHRRPAGTLPGSVQPWAGPGVNTLEKGNRKQASAARP